MKVFVSTYPFGVMDFTPREMLSQEKDLEVVYSPFQRRLTKLEVSEYAKDADILIAGTENLDLLIHSSENLKMISRVGIGLDSVDLSACKAKGIKVCYTPDAVTDAVVELTIGLIISLTRQVVRADREIRKGEWYRHFGKRLGESTVGLIGFGRVGQKVAEHLLPFHPTVWVNDILDRKEEIDRLSQKGLKIEFKSKEEIFSHSDIVSLHLPAYSSTHKIINKDSLKLFKFDACLVNTARGELIDEEELFVFLKEKRIAGAALDVFIQEPYTGSFTELDNVILTQHMGSCSFDCRFHMETQAAEDAVRFSKGLDLLREVPEAEYKYQL